MKLPTFAADPSLRLAQTTHYSGHARQEHSRQLMPQATIDCLTKCAGPTAYKCLGCANDTNCWKQCAGPSAAACIDRCPA